MSNYTNRLAYTHIVASALPPNTPLETIIAIRNRVISETNAFINSLDPPFFHLTTATYAATLQLRRTHRLYLAVSDDGIVYKNETEDPSYPYTYKFEKSTGIYDILRTNDGKSIWWYVTKIYSAEGDQEDVVSETAPLVMNLVRALAANAFAPSVTTQQAVNEAKKYLRNLATEDWRARFPQLFELQSPFIKPSRRTIVYRRR